MHRLHSYVWIVWLGLVLWMISLARNPFYLFLLWLYIAIINLYTRTAAQTVWNSLWTIWASLGIIPMSALFNALTTHFGLHVLFTIPGNIPLLSGDVTSEALVYGLSNGLVLSVIINAFWTFNRNMPIQTLLRLIPRRFYSIAIISSIAVTFIPLTMRQYQQIKEAQAIRGHRWHGIRDISAIIMPLLSGSLERAFQLAEVLTARGFHQPITSSDPHSFQRWSTLLGLILIFFGWQWKRFFPQNINNPDWIGQLLFLLGGISLFLPFWLLGKTATHTRYHYETWQARDWWAMSGQIILGIGLIWFQFRADPSLSYSPYPSLSLPIFNPWLGMLIGGLTLPALLQGQKLHD